jgi:hypothetical protein
MAHDDAVDEDEEYRGPERRRSQPSFISYFRLPDGRINKVIVTLVLGLLLIIGLLLVADISSRITASHRSRHVDAVFQTIFDNQAATLAKLQTDEDLLICANDDRVQLEHGLALLLVSGVDNKTHNPDIDRALAILADVDRRLSTAKVNCVAATGGTPNPTYPPNDGTTPSTGGG